MSKEDIIVYIVIGFFGTVSILYFGLWFLSAVTKSPWFCRVLGWHDGKGEDVHYKKNDFYHVNPSSTCSKCGKRVIQDSQGNWF